MRGFRPGKVPMAHLKKLYGKRRDGGDDRGADPRDQRQDRRPITVSSSPWSPRSRCPSEETEVEKVIGGQSDLAYTLALEVLPKIELADFKGITLERPVAEVTDAQIERGARQDRRAEPAVCGRRARAARSRRATGSSIDFTGTLEGEPFEGGTGGDVGVNVGSGTFIPGFEDQLIGMAAGETRQVKVTFPSNYMNEHLAGKDAEFDVTAKSVEAPGTVTVDDAFAKQLGLESLDKLKEAVKGRLQQEHAGLSRQSSSASCLISSTRCTKFALPPTLAEEEFKNVWKAVESDLKAQGRSFEDEGTTEEKAREEYRGIAERRVRLGLVLAEIGERNNITVTDEEITRAIVEHARQVPGREQEVWELYQKNPGALASIRAPIFEEKVVDFLLELATVSEKQVSARRTLQGRRGRKERRQLASGCSVRPAPLALCPVVLENVRGLFCPRESWI